MEFRALLLLTIVFGAEDGVSQVPSPVALAPSPGPASAEGFYSGDQLPSSWRDALEDAGVDPNRIGYYSTRDEWYLDELPTCIGYGYHSGACDVATLVCAGTAGGGTFGYSGAQVALIAEMLGRGDTRHHLCPESTLPFVIGDLHSPYWRGSLERAGLDPSRVGYSNPERQWYANGEPTCIGFGYWDSFCDDTMLVCAGTDGTFGYGRLQAALIAEMIDQGDERHHMCPVTPPCGDLRIGDCLPSYWLELMEGAGLDPYRVGYSETDGEWYVDGEPTCIGFGHYNGPCDAASLVCAGGVDGTFGYGSVQVALVAEVVAAGREQHDSCPVCLCGHELELIHDVAEELERQLSATEARVERILYRLGMLLPVY